MSNEASKNHNIIIQKVTEPTITITVDGKVQRIPNNNVALQTLLEQHQTQQIQIGEKVYNIGEIGQAEFNTIVNQYHQESKSSRYLRWVLLIFVPLLALGLAYFWYQNKVLSEPLVFSVRVDNHTPNSELPQPEAKITLNYGDKTETQLVATEAIFKSIPANFKNEKIQVKCEVEGFFNIDTTLALTDKLLIVPIYRDNSLASISGNVSLDTSSDQLIALEGVEVEVQHLRTLTDGNGNFTLQIPFAQQRVQQRVIIRKKGYNTWDQTVPVIANEQMKITLRPLR